MMHGELVETTNWLPKGKLTIGITSGGTAQCKQPECQLKFELMLPEKLQFKALRSCAVFAGCNVLAVLTPPSLVTCFHMAGASTPDKAVEEVLAKVFKIKDPSFTGIAARECAPIKVPSEEH
jgi:hypothetical protein